MFATSGGHCATWMLYVRGIPADKSFNLCDVKLAPNDLYFQTSGNSLMILSSAPYYSDISFIVSYYSINEFDRVGNYLLVYVRITCYITKNQFEDHS